MLYRDLPVSLSILLSLIIDASIFQVSVPFSESQGQIFTVQHKSRQHQFCRCASCSRRRALICAIYHAALNPRLLSRDLRFQTPSISRTTICSAILAPNANFNHFFLTNPLCCTNPSPLHWWSAVDRYQVLSLCPISLGWLVLRYLSL